MRTVHGARRRRVELQKNSKFKRRFAGREETSNWCKLDMSHGGSWASIQVHSGLDEAHQLLEVGSHDEIGA
jgi:hypothetical protein